MIITSPDRIEFYMRAVYLAAWQSKDPRTKIGAILVKDGDISCTGYNGLPRKVIDFKERYDNRDLKLKLVCHAEFNAITNAARKGICTLGTQLITQGIPCGWCAKSIIQAGLSSVIYHAQWPHMDYDPMWVESTELTKTMFSECGIELIRFDKKLNLTGFVNGKTVEV